MANSYIFTKKKMRSFAEEQGVEITNFYMIGDNPLSDIKGGNENDCTTIMTRTGVWSGFDTDGVKLDNDAANPADHVVNNMYEAYKLILEKENIQELMAFD